jgi:hypothetical protein
MPSDTQSVPPGDVSPAGHTAAVAGIRARIKRHKIAEWTLAYAAFAFAALHGMTLLSDQGGEDLRQRKIHKSEIQSVAGVGHSLEPYGRNTTAYLRSSLNHGTLLLVADHCIQVFCFAAVSRACLSAAQFGAYLSASLYLASESLNLPCFANTSPQAFSGSAQWGPF